MNLWRLSACACRAILGAAALVVPGDERREWWREWTAELWYLLDANRRECRPGLKAHWDTTRFCLGAFHDALWLRRSSPRPQIGRLVSFESPFECLGFLTALAALSLYLAWRLPGVWHQLHLQGMVDHLLLVAISFAILPSTIVLGIGQCPETEYSPTRAQRIRRGVFLILKFVLVAATVFLGTLDFIPLFGPAGLQHLLLLGYILGFRWALADQQRRCPVCLRLLVNPIRFGQASHVFLDWFGTESVCEKGHGFLHVPEIPATSYGASRWLAVDASWRGLSL